MSIHLYDLVSKTVAAANALSCSVTEILPMVRGGLEESIRADILVLDLVTDRVTDELEKFANESTSLKRKSFVVPEFKNFAKYYLHDEE